MNKENDTLRECSITTVDNPYDIYTQFDEWLDFDRLMGYFTLELIARTVMTSEFLSEKDQLKELNDAFDKIIYWHQGLYKRVYPKND